MFKSKTVRGLVSEFTKGFEAIKVKQDAISKEAQKEIDVKVAAHNKALVTLTGKREVANLESRDAGKAIKTVQEMFSFTQVD